MVETGRHLNIERNQRFCPLCLMKNIFVLEDEYDFFFERESYEPLRQECFKQYWINNRPLDVFYFLMSSKNKQSILIIANFLVKLFEKHTQLVG